MRLIHGLLTFAAVIVCRAISWVLILSWQLPVHYTELQTEDKLKSSFYELAMFRLCSRDTHTFFDDVVSRVDTPVIPVPEVYSTNGEKKERPKSWWSSEERSATLELSYLTAVVDSKLVLLSNPEGVTIKQSSPIQTPREVDDLVDEKQSDGSRERSHARDWDAMPEVVKESKGRFHLRGGKHVYTDSDLAKNLERHRALSRKTRRGFSGWNRHSGASAPIDKIEQIVDYENSSSSIANDPGVKGFKNPRRDSAQIHYSDFIPSQKVHKMPLSEIQPDTPIVHTIDKSKDNQEVNDDDGMVWEVNPSLV